MKSAAPQGLHVATCEGASAFGGPPQIGEQMVDAAQHFGGRTASEREQQNASRIDAPFDQVSDAVHEGPRLAGACAGDD
jgi:hypothetical protein